ncbi:Primosomal protein N' [Pirellula sp. SH-Sr6A]|uniref:replication restart helicase PriA n=1 Tax=Pirellula sp. SH-Sr6A TaxID=1632865 RepID=UPI00078B6F42|nr:primosomal protein N' [Pirellula sp. SH-Sr6A]AMV32691.1 Primosomal protein N' [Pirellula sp. SH-Sr6A]
MELHQGELFPDDRAPWEIDAANETPSASVVFPEAPYGPYDYRIPDELAGIVQPAMRVVVPLGKGNREIVGYVLSIQMAMVPQSSLKPILRTVDHEPLCNGSLLQLIQWMSRYYLVPLGQVFEAVIPAGVRAGAGTRNQTLLRPSELASEERAVTALPTKQRQTLQQLILADEPLSIEQLKHLAQCSDGVIKKLRDIGLIESYTERVMTFDASTVPGNFERIPAPALSADQRLALQTIFQSIESGEHSTILLHGVTGSGKTEVYMQAIEQVVSYGRQAIVLVPEISLTPQTRSRFQHRFQSVAVLHSSMSGPERHYQWRRIADGHAQVIIGPRSAIFAPAPYLGLVILDEEHENTFKQETVPRYHARDVAIHRTALEKIPLVLGSATPSLETFHRARRGQFRMVSLPRRILNRPLPEVTTIDLRSTRIDVNRGSLSRPLLQAIERTLAEKGQTILLLNRRGYATSIQCPSCGHVVSCPDCDLPLTHHRDGSKATCHYCDYTIAAPNVCPKCGFDAIRFAGLGTQKLEMEVQARFPDAVIARMDSDTMKKPGSHERVLAEFRGGKVQILLGTQMIAKGLDFPNVLLVGVINADTTLHFPDFRASEKTFQLVTQVAGRTGRGDRAGEVLVQTYSPDHPAIVAACKHDYKMFSSQELKQREEFGYPPFSSLARIIFRGPDQVEANEFAEGVVKKIQLEIARVGAKIRVLGPAPPPIAKLRGHYRFHAMLISQDAAALNALLSRIQSSTKPPGENLYLIDIDPQDML